MNSCNAPLPATVSAIGLALLASLACSSSKPTAAPPTSDSPPAAPAGPIESPDQASATAASLSWVSLLDSDQYAESWARASSRFKSAVDEATWVKKATVLRGPLGKLLARRLKTVQHAMTLPGAPDGDYFVLKFDTSFEHKNAGVETVAMVKDSDASWRVTGYFIK